MRVFILSFLLLFSISSCSKDDNDCLDKKSEIIEKYDEFIELAEGDEAEKAVLIRNKNVALDKLDC